MKHNEDEHDVVVMKIILVYINTGKNGSLVYICVYIPTGIILVYILVYIYICVYPYWYIFVYPYWYIYMVIYAHTGTDWY